MSESTTLEMVLDDIRDVDPRRGERGQGLVEYAFIISLVVIVLIIAVQTLGHQTNSMYSNISNGFVGR